MKDIDAVFAKLKYKVSDFIVEEIGENWETKISEKSNFGTTPDFKNLNSQQDFLWCEMEKFDIDHFNAIKDISTSLSKNINDIGYAGVKDKSAWTSQRISIFHPDIEKIKTFNHQKIFLKNFKWNKRKIKMGYLKSNHFIITLRDIDKKDAMKIVKHIKKIKWFPNYFGPQRFGLRKNNVKVGKLILKRRFKEAVWAILTDVGEEQDEVNVARLRLQKEKDFLKALEYFPHYLRLEKEILYYLSRRTDDFVGVIRRVGRKNMLMFVNSVQSKIFNEILEKALEEGIDFTKDGQKSCILAGYKTRFFDGRLGEIEQSVLSEHGIELKDFDVKEVSFLRIKGLFRKAVTEVEKIKVDIFDDEEFSGCKKIVLDFILPSGVYATTFLENFFIFK